jgi:hypothetical protein
MISCVRSLARKEKPVVGMIREHLQQGGRENNTHKHEPCVCFATFLVLQAKQVRPSRTRERTVT